MSPATASIAVILFGAKFLKRSDGVRLLLLSLVFHPDGGGPDLPFNGHLVTADIKRPICPSGFPFSLDLNLATLLQVLFSLAVTL